MRDLTDDEKAELQRHCIFCKEPDFILAAFAMNLAFDIYCVECRAGYKVTHTTLPWQLLVEPRQTSQRALDALTDGSSVMDVTTMLKRIREDIALALRRFKIAPEDIPAASGAESWIGCSQVAMARRVGRQPRRIHARGPGR